MTTAIMDRAGSLQRYVWSSPALAALLYPLALAALFGSAALVHEGAVGAGALAFIVSLSLCLAVPAVALRVAWLLGHAEAASAGEIRARRLAHLAVASPPLFTLIGVALYLLHAPANSDYLLWALIWLGGLVAIALGRADVPAARPTRAAIAPWLVELHGLTALALLLFLLPHVANHVAGIWSAATHVHVMKALRRIYRNPVVEPVLVAVVLFQIGSGVVLLWRRTARPSDLFGTLQTAAAGYLAVFLSSHLTAVFVLGRAVMKVDTDFSFASGAPAGLLLDSWNVRLVLHYFLAVCCLFVHVGSGVRAVMLSRYPVRTANRTAWSVIGVGALAAAVAIVGLAGFHLAPAA